MVGHDGKPPASRDSPIDNFPALSESRSPIASVDRALKLLTILASYGAEGAPLGKLASRLNEDKATIHRAINALCHRFYAVQDPATGFYSLGPAALAVTDEYIRQDGLRPMLHRALLTVCAAANETVHAAVPEGTFVRYIDKVEPARDIRVGSYVGARYTMRTTALGRAMLSIDCPSEQDLERMFGAEAPELWPHIEEAARRGFATEHEENEVGVTCVAVPVIFGGRAAAALSVSGPTDRMDGRIDELAALVRNSLTNELTAGFSLPETRRELG